MTDRIDQVLNDELPESQLTSGERVRLARLRATVGAVVDEVRAVEAPDLTSRVMAALEAEPTAEPRWTFAELIEWMWRPRPILWRPAYAFGIGALLLFPLALMFPAADADPPQATAGPVEVPSDVQMYVQFRFEAPGAADVALAGSFTEWAPEIRLVETMPGVWSALVPLDPGVHDYTFIVDGETWVPDPAAPQVDDGFGGTNSRLFLTTPVGNA